MVNKVSRLRKITDQVVMTTYPIRSLPNVNLSAIVLDDFAVVIDSGPDTVDGKDFRDKLVTNFKVHTRYLVLTHYHRDHTGGINAFKDVKSICSEFIPKTKRLGHTEIFLNAYTLIDNDFKLEITNCGGHTQDSSYIYYPKEKVIFAGDLVFTIGYPPYGGDSTCDPKKWLAVLEQMLKIKPEYVIPGHGPALSFEDFVQYVEDFKSFEKTIRDAYFNRITFSKLNIVEFKDIPYVDWMARTTFNRWIKYYQMHEELKEIPKNLMNMTPKEKETYLTKKTLIELNLIAQKLKIELDGRKKQRIDQILQHLDIL